MQILKDKETLAELDNSTFNIICRSIRQDSNQPIAEVAVTRLKWLAFWFKHQDQTMCVVGMNAKPLVMTTLIMINLLMMQKHLEDTWASEIKDPDYIAKTLDTSSAMKAFEKVKTILRVCGVTGVPLVYVVRHQLIPEEEDDKGD